MAGRPRGGKPNLQQATFASVYVGTGDAMYAATAARYAQPSSAAVKVPAQPIVAAEIARLQTQRLFAEALPAAVGCLIEIITSPKAPAGARVQAAKVVMDRTLGTDGAGQAKEPHEMTAEELAKAIDELERMASARAKPIEPEQPPESDVFG
jgi:NAD(P)H-hydrate repair Nnr-like enzyme with NAD(P)H-hydrate epimerase domain